MKMAVTMILKALSLSLRGFRHLEVALAHFEPLHSKFCLVTRIHLPLLGGDDHEDVDEDGEDNGNGSVCHNHQDVGTPTLSIFAVGLGFCFF